MTGPATRPRSRLRTLPLLEKPINKMMASHKFLLFHPHISLILQEHLVNDPVLNLVDNLVISDSKNVLFRSHPSKYRKLNLIKKGVNVYISMLIFKNRLNQSYLYSPSPSITPSPISPIYHPVIFYNTTGLFFYLYILTFAFFIEASASYMFFHFLSGFYTEALCVPKNGRSA